MDRRTFLPRSGSTLTIPCVLFAQSAKRVYRIAIPATLRLRADELIE